MIEKMGKRRILVMKKLKIIIVTVLAIGSLAACGGDTTSKSIISQVAVAESETEIETDTETKPTTEVETETEAETETTGRDEEAIKNSQLATITSVYIMEPLAKYKSLYPDMIQWILKNESDMVIKNYIISILAYDSNGYPVKIKDPYTNTANFNQLVFGEAVNVLPGETYGDDGISLATNHNIFYAIAIIKELEFYEGDKWENPYYDIWIEKYRETPIPLDDLSNMYN